MKPAIVMCNYYGMCDGDGNAVGHAPKVTNEYSEMLKEKFALSLAASPCIVNASNSNYFTEVRPIKYDICAEGNTIIKRIADKIKLLSNISQIIRSEGIYFFYQVDFFFFFYICFFYRRTHRRKIICLVYHQDFTGGSLGEILQRIYLKALKKIDGIIYTQFEKRVNHPNSVWMPDFLYCDEKYRGYQSLPKKKQVVCVGTMNRYKQLEQLVDIFSKINMPLIIAGRFDDKERFHKLTQVKTSNVEIYDTILPEEEYLEMIASSQYSFLPYDMDQYISRTSGVLLESIYLGSIPIAPSQLLLQNSLPGMGYNEMQELLEEKNWRANFTDLFKKVYEKYDKEIFMHRLIRCIEG